MSSAREQGLLSALLDTVMVLAPRGWEHVRLSVTGGHHGLALESLESRGVGAKEPKPKPALGIDPREEAARLGEGLSALSDLIHARGKHWHGGGLELTRSAEFIEFKALDEAGAALWLDRMTSEDAALQVMTDAIFDLLSGTERAFQSLQKTLETQLGRISRMGLEGDRLNLTCEVGAVSLPVMELGRWSNEAFAWRWSWERAPRLRALCAPEAKPEGLSALWRPELWCDLGFAWALCSHVTVALGGRGLLRVDEGGDVVVLAVMSVPA